MARRRTKDIIEWRDGGTQWYENFQVAGIRFRAGLGTDNREEAKRIAARRYADALQGRNGQPPQAQAQLTLSKALATYFLEHGKFCPSSVDMGRIGLTLMNGLGETKPIAKITAADLKQFAARRRSEVSDRSVNVELEHLRTVLHYVAKNHKAVIPDIDWAGKGRGGGILLEVPEERIRALS